VTNAVIGALRVTLGLDTAQLETGMKKAKTSMKGFATEFAKGALTAAAGLISVTSAINGTNAALQKFGDIADKSRAAGLDPEFFQGLAQQARLAGVDIDALSGALNTFNKNTGLAAEGKGKLVSTLQALNPELLKAIQLSTNQADRIRLVADAVAAETDASRQAAIATAAFGGEGIKLVAVLEQGSQRIDEMMNKAREMGLIVDRDLIARADELGDKFDVATEIIDLKLKVALVELAPLLVDAANIAAQFAGFLADGAASLKALLSGDLSGAFETALDRYSRLRTELQNEQTSTLTDPALGIEYGAGGIHNALMGGGVGATNGLGGGARFSDIGNLFGFGTSGRIGSPVPASRAPAATGSFMGDAGLGLIFDPVHVDDLSNSYNGLSGALAGTAGATGPMSLGMESVSTSISNAISPTEEFTASLAEGLTDGLMNVAEAALSGGDALKALSKELMSAGLSLVRSGLNGLFGGLLGGGGLFKTAPKLGLDYGLGLFANGGITDRPAIFGDAGPEAAVPLPDGRTIPVTLNGGTGPKVVVNNFGAPDAVRTETRPDGTIELFVNEAVRRVEGNMAQGKYRNFGVSPGVRRT